MIPLDQTRLYAFVDTAYLHGRDPVELTRQLAGGGADLIQLRAKDWPIVRIEHAAEHMLAICGRHGIRLVVNDHPVVAARVGAHLAHLGQEDFFDAGHTSMETFAESTFKGVCSKGARPGIGLSSHAPEQAQRAQASGAAYVAVGPVFATPTKPGRPAVTLEYVRWAAAHLTGIPWFAIGGIQRSTLESVLEAGARRVCVVSDILNDPNPGAACREFRRVLDRFPLAAAPRAA